MATLTFEQRARLSRLRKTVRQVENLGDAGFDEAEVAQALAVPAPAALANGSGLSVGAEEMTALLGRVDHAVRIAGGVVELANAARNDSRQANEAAKAVDAALRGLKADMAAAISAMNQARIIQFAAPDGTALGTVQGARPEMEAMAELVSAGLRNLYLAGPAGSGKSTLPLHLAQALGVPFTIIPMNEDTTPSVWIGTGNAQGVWQESSFAAALDKPGVICVDEIDAARASVNLGINMPLANDCLAVPRHSDPERRTITRHQGCVIIVTANTWGCGPTAEYCGRSPQDRAFLDRFVGGEFFIDYDRALEERLLTDGRLLARLWRLRDDCLSHKIRRFVGTRTVIAAAKLKLKGWDDQRILDRITCGWSPAEKGKVGL